MALISLPMLAVMLPYYAGLTLATYGLSLFLRRLGCWVWPSIFIGYLLAGIVYIMVMVFVGFHRDLFAFVFDSGGEYWLDFFALFEVIYLAPFAIPTMALVEVGRRSNKNIL